MPDITMCSGEGCVIKEDCYRFKATPNEYRQSYFTEPPHIKGEIPFKCPREAYCLHYWSYNAGE